MIKSLRLGNFSPAKRSNSLKPSFRTLFISMVLMMGFVSVKAQVNSYSFTGAAAAYTAIAPTNVISWTGPVPAPSATLNWDDHTAATVPIGFTFNFNGVDYTNVNVSPNGFITFGGAAPASTNYLPIASLQTYEGAISVYGLNLVNNNVAIRYLTAGVAPNQTFTIEYVGFRSGSTGTINMEIILHETTGVIDLMYKTAAAFGSAKSGQIGLRGENNSDFKVLSMTTVTSWPAVPPGGAMTISPTNTALTNGALVLTRAAGTTITANTRMSWTPPACYAPRALNVTGVAATGATLNWTASPSAPSNGYEYYYTTTPPTTVASMPNAGTTISGSVGAGITTANLALGMPALVSNTLYYVYVRSNCGGAPGGWSAPTSFTTLCTPFADPFVTSIAYVQDFNASAPPAIPACNYTQNTAADPIGVWKTSFPIGAPGPFGFLSQHINIKTSSLNANSATYFTEGISMTGGQSYRLSYRYGADNQFATTEQNMTVMYGSAPYQANMTVTLQDHPAFKGGPYTNVINFIPATSGVYYFGFYDYSAINNATILLDDINIDKTSCFAPALNAVTGITSGGATISWTAPTPAPSGGYQYYLTDISSANPPSGATPIINVGAGITTVTLAGLSQSTTYYYWVRSSCGGTEFSGWSLQGTFTTLVGSPPPLCTPSGAGFPQDPNGITNVTFSNVNNTTGIEPNNYGDYTALIGYVGQGTTVPVAITYRTGYTYDTKIWVDWNNDGDFVDAGENVYTGMSTAANPTVLNASFTVPAGATLGQHRMRIGGIDFGPFASPATDPCRAGNYQAYEDYSCWVTTPPPALTLSSYSTTACAGVGFAVNITSTLANYNQYTWSPATGVTGTAPNYTLNPAVSTTYVLTANNTVNFNTVTKTFIYTVNPAPSAVTVTPATGTVCDVAGTAVALTATGGQIAGSVVYTENFNGLAPGWVTTSNQPLGDWVLGADGYAPFSTAIHSNDNSQFAMTESDAPGSGTTTNTTLTSPAISLVGYTSASFSFWQFYKYYNGPEGGQVQISNTSSTGPFTTLQTYGSAANVGSETAFVNSGAIDLSAYLGQTIYIRFAYDATWDWGWAIDNFVVLGSAPSPITWTPIAGLWNDLAHTSPYVAGTAATTVYALPTVTTTYVATATGLGCTTPSNNAVITVNSCGPCPVSTTWNGSWSNGVPDSTKAAIFTSNYTFSVPFAACSLTNNGAVLTVNTGTTLTIQYGVTVSSGSLTFNSGSSLVQVNNTVNTGNIIYNRDTMMRKFDYTYWSSPVQPQTLFNLSPATLVDKYYWWNAATYNWVSAVPNTTNMNPAQGYIIRGPQNYSTSSFTLFPAQFIGVPNNGDYTVPISVVSATNNLNLLGNPYASAISADLFMSNVSNSAALGTGTTLYFWTHNTDITNNAYTNSDYASYNYTGGVGTAPAPATGNNNSNPNGFINAGQGFMAKGLANGNVTFKNSMRVAGNNSQFYRSNQPSTTLNLERNRVWLELKNSQGAYKQALVGYIENATNGYESGFDGEILEAGNTVSFYSVLDASKLSIQGRGLPFDQNDQVVLGYQTSAATNFEINLSNFDGLFSTQDVFVEDHLLNVIHNLKDGPYSFVTEVGTFDTRFTLRFTNSTLGVSNPTLTENAVVVYKNNTDIHVETSNIVMKTVKIFDTRGRLILEKGNIDGSAVVFANVNAGHQVLLVQITSADNVVVSKKIIF